MLTIKKLILICSGLCLIQNTALAQQAFSLTRGSFPNNSNINCFSSIPPRDALQRARFIKNYSAFVSRHTFVIPLNNYQSHHDSIRPCFSQKGWMEFERALEQSGNVQLVHSKGYVGTGEIEGDINLTHQKNSAVWESDTPLTVIYQNQQNRFNQRLTVHLRIEEKAQGRVEITQIVGVPRKLISTP